MKEWVVHLRGEKEDLEGLLSLPDTGVWSLAKEPKRVVLRSPHLTGDQDAVSAARIGKALVQQVNAVGRLALDRYRSVSVSGLSQRDDDGVVGSQNISLEPARVRLPLRILDGADLAEDNAVPALASGIARLTASGSSKEVLRFLTENELTWINLYKILELIRADVGGLIEDLGWASRKEMERFERTAQDPRLIGDAARHGVLRGDPVAVPVSLRDAQSLMMRVVRRYLLYRSENPS